jgi:hypothetical protein
MFSRNKAGERRVSPATYKVLLTAHIIVSVAWIGVVIAKIALKLFAVTAAEPATSAALFFATTRLDFTFPPLALSTILTGVLLSLGTKWGLVQHYWVATKLALTFGVIVTAVQFGTRIPRPIGQPSVEVGFVAVITAPATLLLTLSATLLLMLVVATILSTYKPWGKTPLGRRAALRRPAGRATLATSVGRGE